MSLNWEYNNWKFDYNESYKDYDLCWAGHKYFAADLVINTSPKLIVELGTENGTSFFSFCQAVKDFNINTALFAVDTWEGDAHSGFYDNKVWENFNLLVHQYYQSLNITLLKMKFDEAVDKFENNSIDILHIDGYHTYEAVKHDYNTWKHKVKNDGIILFHDIEVKMSDFGVYKLWEELKQEFSTIEFIHSFGLGILCKNTKTFSDIKQFQAIWQNYYKEIFEKNILKYKLENQELKNKELSEITIKNSELFNDQNQNLINQVNILNDNLVNQINLNNELKQSLLILNQDINKQEKSIKIQNEDIKKIKNTITWKIGLSITWLPYQILRAIKAIMLNLGIKLKL